MKGGVAPKTVDQYFAGIPEPSRKTTNGAELIGSIILGH